MSARHRRTSSNVSKKTRCQKLENLRSYANFRAEVRFRQFGSKLWDNGVFDQTSHSHIFLLQWLLGTYEHIFPLCSACRSFLDPIYGRQRSPEPLQHYTKLPKLVLNSEKSRIWHFLGPFVSAACMKHAQKALQGIRKQFEKKRDFEICIFRRVMPLFSQNSVFTAHSPRWLC